MDLKGFANSGLPDAPGVYFFRRGDDILYIGKATSLKDRVRSYFAPDLIDARGPRIVDMVFQADSLKWEESDSVLEAMISEANLIKKHQPRYNVQEKDDKSWNYVVITDERFPRVFTMRKRELDAELAKKSLKIRDAFGPYPHGGMLREGLKIIRKMFPFADKKSLGKDKYQFYRQIGLTPDTASEEARKEYLVHIRHVKLFFEGKKDVICRSLKRQMREYVKKLEFEKAAEVKRRLFALEHIHDIALIKEEANIERSETAEAGFRIEAYDVAHTSGKESVAVMTVITDGEIDKSQYRKFKLSPDIGNDDLRSIEEVLARRFAHPEWKHPDLIVIDGGAGQKSRAEKVLVHLSNAAQVVSVVKDDRHKAREILGSEDAKRYEKQILLANAEAHRFAVAYHRKRSRMSHRRLSGL